MDKKLKNFFKDAGYNPDKLKSGEELNEIASGKTPSKNKKHYSKNTENRILQPSKTKVNKSGGGINANINGEKFERSLSLLESLKSAGYVVTGEGYITKNHKSYKDGVLLKHSKLHKFLLEKFGRRAKDILSHNLNPDECVICDNIVYIIEIKNQNSHGSVDEKIQTAPYKLDYYNKLFDGLGFDDIKFIYVMNDFFKQPRYRSIFEYFDENGIIYFFNEIPLDQIGF